MKHSGCALRRFLARLSILQRPHRQSLNNGFAHEKGEDGNRQDDQGRGGADAGPVDLAVGDEVTRAGRIKK